MVHSLQDISDPLARLGTVPSFVVEATSVMSLLLCHNLLWRICCVRGLIWVSMAAGRALVQPVAHLWFGIVYSRIWVRVVSKDELLINSHIAPDPSAAVENDASAISLTDSDAIVERSSFRSIEDTPAVGAFRGSLKVRDVQFEDNHSKIGILFVMLASSLFMENVEFNRNVAAVEVCMQILQSTLRVYFQVASAFTSFFTPTTLIDVYFRDNVGEYVTVQV